MFDFFANLYSQVQDWLMQAVVIPMLFAIDGMSYAEESVNAVDWFLFGLIQIAIILLVLSPLERFIPVETYDSEKVSKSTIAKAKWVDIFYTLMHRLGIVKLILFLLFSDLFFALDGQLHDIGFHRFNVESWWPGVTSIPWVSFLVYLVILDLGEYLYHRASHQWNWWWQLHALHHSQHYMSVWTDNRNHLVDDVGHSLMFALLALIIGVEPSQFIWLVALSQLIQSWQHGNLNITHGIFKCVLISPRYHRLHHAIGMGYEVPGKPGVLGGCNFGILFPWWDMLFRTAIFDEGIHPTGVRGMEVSHNPLIHQWQGIVHSVKTFFK